MIVTSLFIKKESFNPKTRKLQRITHNQILKKLHRNQNPIIDSAQFQYQRFSKVNFMHRERFTWITRVSLSS